MNRVTWLGRLGMWLLEHDLPLTYGVVRLWVGLLEELSEARAARRRYKATGTWP